MKSRGILRQIGFDTVTETIYDTLLLKGPLSIADIARLVGKHRPVIYKSLPKLISQNLITPYRKGKRLLYKVESPEYIISLLKKQNEKVEMLLPEYIRTFENKNKGFTISHYEGERGIKEAYENLIKDLPKQGILRRIESPRDYQKNKKYYPKLYWERAGSSGDVEKYVITNRATNDRRRKNLNRSSKSLSGPDNKNFDHNITQIFTHNRVCFIDYDTETAVMIESERFAAFYKDIFGEFFKKL